MLNIVGNLRLQLTFVFENKILVIESDVRDVLIIYL